MFISLVVRGELVDKFLVENLSEQKFISSESVKVVSPIIKDFLKLKQVEHFKGEIYSAA